MSELIQMRQRIKAIETIKKITHAMRLTSMSCQLQLKSNQKNLVEYISSINSLFYKIQAESPTWQHPIMRPAHSPESKKLIILIGSQKGLCGNFNNLLFKTFIKHSDLSDLHNTNIIAIGKKAVDFCQEHAADALIKTHPIFNMYGIQIVVRDLMSTITQNTHPYSSVVIWSNKLKTFFIQQPHETTVIPFDAKNNNGQAVEKSCSEYIWQQSADQILDTLTMQYLEAHIYQLLFESLLAEHAARFISMDNSTRNADNLLEIHKLAYNKARQAKITKELTELSSSF